MLSRVVGAEKVAVGLRMERGGRRWRTRWGYEGVFGRGEFFGLKVLGFIFWVMESMVRGA